MTYAVFYSIIWFESIWVFEITIISSTKFKAVNTEYYFSFDVNTEIMIGTTESLVNSQQLLTEKPLLFLWSEIFELGHS